MTRIFDTRSEAEAQVAYWREVTNQSWGQVFFVVNKWAAYLR